MNYDIVNLQIDVASQNSEKENSKPSNKYAGAASNEFFLFHTENISIYITYYSPSAPSVYKEIIMNM
jgi:hypothetical protein